MQEKRIQLGPGEEIASFSFTLKMILIFTIGIGILSGLLYDISMSGSTPDGVVCNEEMREIEDCSDPSIFFPFLVCGGPMLLFLALMWIQTIMHVFKIGGQNIQNGPNSMTWKWYTIMDVKPDLDEGLETTEVPWWEDSDDLLD